MNTYSRTSLFCKQEVSHNYADPTYFGFSNDKKYTVIEFVEEHYDNELFGKIDTYFYTVKDDYNNICKLYHTNAKNGDPYLYQPKFILFLNMEQFFYSEKEWRVEQLKKLI